MTFCLLYNIRYQVSVGHTTRAIFFQVKLDKCKLLTLNNHNTYSVGSEEDIVSKQTILTYYSYTYCTIYIYIYTVGKHKNYVALLYLYIMLYGSHSYKLYRYTQQYNTSTIYVYHAERESPENQSVWFLRHFGRWVAICVHWR